MSIFLVRESIFSVESKFKDEKANVSIIPSDEKFMVLDQAAYAVELARF